MGSDDLHKKRKARTVSRKRVEQKAVLIALEDTKSSKYYFESLLKDKKFFGEVVFAKHIGTNPRNVLKALENHKIKNPKTIFEKEWIVIDRDDWSKYEFNGVLEEARKKGVCVAFSNKAFELWILLHFEYVGGYMSRKDLNSKLNEYFLKRFGTEYTKSSQDVYALIVGEQNIAIKNAKSLVKKHEIDNGALKPYEQNSLTMIYQLVECLNSLSEKDAKCVCFPLDG